MRFSLIFVLATFCGVQTVTAICCYYGSVGGCRRAVDNPLYRRQLQDRAPQMESRAACCCAAGTVDLCETHCVSVVTSIPNLSLPDPNITCRTESGP
ncbi:hypothetical protein PsYK624_108330 [Phanerochaete sordida]|uniref:Uncharacterized protein n=1 Tax=Phanerochaete sordida TaxID=48140 RepID=A0A9P3LHZ9_9APHY|nr:hypothetical protein PsYK624_108330 [Phanerochaete sordida]